eukprot:5979967-Amphidinium_carterae.1
MSASVLLAFLGVVENMRTSAGTLFGLPVVLDVANNTLAGKKAGSTFPCRSSYLTLQMNEQKKKGNIQ